MYKKLGQFALPVLMFAFVGTAQAEVIDFGPDGSSFFKPTSVWEVFYADTTLPDYNAGGYKSVADATGNQWVAANYRVSEVAEFVAVKDVFNLDGLWLAGAWGNQTLTVTGYAGGEEIATVSFVISTTAQEYTSIFDDFKAIDSFTIRIGNEYVPGGRYWALGSVAVTVVPEPEAYAMLLAGLGLVGVMARRRRRI